MTQQKIPVWCRGKEWCALKSTAKILGRKWLPVIVYHLNDTEGLRFTELQERIGGITNKTLSDNLETLEDQGIIERTVEDDRPVNITYSVTSFGEQLVPLIEEMVEWGQANLTEAEKDEAWIT